jgi:hypothetical protein
VLGSCFAQQVQFALGKRDESPAAPCAPRSWTPCANAGSCRTARTTRPCISSIVLIRDRAQEFENILSMSLSIANGALILERPDDLFADYHYNSRFPLQTFQECIERRDFIRKRINSLIDVDFVILTLKMVRSRVRVIYEHNTHSVNHREISHEASISIPQRGRMCIQRLRTNPRRKSRHENRTSGFADPSRRDLYRRRYIRGKREFEGDAVMCGNSVASCLSPRILFSVLRDCYPLKLCGGLGAGRQARACRVRRTSHGFCSEIFSDFAFRE